MIKKNKYPLQSGTLTSKPLNNNASGKNQRNNGVCWLKKNAGRDLLRVPQSIQHVKNWIKKKMHLDWKITQTGEVSLQQLEQGVLGGRDSPETKTDAEIKRHLKTNPFSNFFFVLLYGTSCGSMLCNASTAKRILRGILGALFIGAVNSVSSSPGS